MRKEERKCLPVFALQVLYVSVRECELRKMNSHPGMRAGEKRGLGIKSHGTWIHIESEADKEDEKGEGLNWFSI